MRVIRARAPIHDISRARDTPGNALIIIIAEARARAAARLFKGSVNRSFFFFYRIYAGLRFFFKSVIYFAWAQRKVEFMYRRGGNAELMEMFLRVLRRRGSRLARARV